VILADTSVWVRHLRQGDSVLTRLLDENLLLIHPFVIGELACGNLLQREEILSHFETLPAAKISEHDEVMQLIKSKRLFGKGLGWIDAHLLASAALSHAKLWTLDKALQRSSAALGINFN